MNPYNLDITKIVKYICLTAVSIVGIIFGCGTVQKIYETKAMFDFKKRQIEEYKSKFRNL